MIVIHHLNLKRRLQKEHIRNTHHLKEKSIEATNQNITNIMKAILEKSTNTKKVVKEDLQRIVIMKSTVVGRENLMKMMIICKNDANSFSFFTCTYYKLFISYVFIVYIL